MNLTPETPEKALNESKAAPAAAKAPSPKKEKKPVAKKPAAKKTAAKKSKDGVNKSEEIRKVAKDLQSKGEKVRPVTIVKTLKAKGITVAPPQVSMVLGKMGFKRRKRRKGGAAPGASGVVTKKASKSSISVEDLINAKKAVAAFGGNAAKLVDAVSALVELQ